MFSFRWVLAEHTKDHADGSPAGGPTKPHHPTGLYLKNSLLWFELGDGKPILTVEVVAVRGDRLVLARFRVGYRDGDERVLEEKIIPLLDSES